MSLAAFKLVTTRTFFPMRTEGSGKSKSNARNNRALFCAEIDGEFEQFFRFKESAQHLRYLSDAQVHFTKFFIGDFRSSGFCMQSSNFSINDGIFYFFEEWLWGGQTRCRKCLHA